MTWDSRYWIFIAMWLIFVVTVATKSIGAVGAVLVAVCFGALTVLAVRAIRREHSVTSQPPNPAAQDDRGASSR